MWLVLKVHLERVVSFVQHVRNIDARRIHTSEHTLFHIFLIYAYVGCDSDECFWLAHDIRAHWLNYIGLEHLNFKF